MGVASFNMERGNCIWKYGKTFNVGMGQVENGCLYLRCGSNFVITTAKQDKMLIDERLSLLYCEKWPFSRWGPEPHFLA